MELRHHSPNVRLFGVHGLQRSGKTTLAHILLDVAPADYSYNAKNVAIAFADPLKKMLSAITGLPVDKMETEEDKLAECPKALWTHWTIDEIQTPTDRAYLREDFAQSGHAKFASLEKAEEAAVEKFVAWLAEDKRTVREALRHIGTECFRQVVDRRYWTRLAWSAIWAAQDAGAHVVIFHDVRFNEEAELLTRHSGQIIKIVKHEATTPEAGKPVHASEAGIDPSFIKFKITNRIEDGLPQLRAQAVEFWVQWTSGCGRDYILPPRAAGRKIAASEWIAAALRADHRQERRWRRRFAKVPEEETDEEKRWWDYWDVCAHNQWAVHIDSTSTVMTAAYSAWARSRNVTFTSHDNSLIQPMDWTPRVAILLEEPAYVRYMPERSPMPDEPLRCRYCKLAACNCVLADL